MGTTADKLAKLQQTKAALKTAINGTGSTVGDLFSAYPGAVTNGKAEIAAAVVEKGVQTAPDAPFDVIAAAIKKIKSSPKNYTVAVESGTVDCTGSCSDGDFEGNIPVSESEVTFTLNEDGSIRIQLYGSGFLTMASGYGDLFMDIDFTLQPLY